MTDQMKGCPDADVLVEFLQGRLEPPNLHLCESHVADCSICHETLRCLNADDTLSQYVVSAMDEMGNVNGIESDRLDNSSFNLNPTKTEASDDHEVASLMERLLSPNNLGLNAGFQAGAKHPREFDGGRIPSPAEAEVLADRAAEVLRYVTPTEDGENLGTIGDYLLVRLIGAGSTGVVFHAIDQSLDRSVALKVLRPSLGSIARERFMAEARVAASIEHSNVVTIYQVGQQERLAFIAMQWLPGQTLEQKLAAEGSPSDSEIRRVTKQVAQGLAAAHKKQLVHRDIKPANIWICEDDGEVKILDFGLARIGDDDPGLTATGMLAGTPNFMSPEQARGLELDGRSDLFSLGCVMYRLLTGKLPFGSPTVLATLQAIQSEQPDSPASIRSDASRELSDLSMSLLEKQPANRPGSATQLIEMLDSPRGQWPVNVIDYESMSARTEDSNSVEETRDLVLAPRKVVKPAKQDKASAFFHGGRWIAATLLAAFGFGGVWYAPQIIRIVNDQGELVIKTDDDDIEIEVLQEGKLVRVLDTQTRRSFNIESGSYQIKARKEGSTAGETNSFEVTPTSLTMSRGGKRTVTVEIKNKPRPGIIDAIEMTREDLQRLDFDPDAITTEFSNGNGKSLSVHRGVSDKPINVNNNSSVSAFNNKSDIETKPIFNGRTFKDWLSIATRDRHPKTVADALVACSKLATTPQETTLFKSTLREIVRTHGNNSIGIDEDSDKFTIGFLKSFSTFEPDELVDFVLVELKDGTPESRKFCQLVLGIAQVYKSDNKMMELHREAIVKRAIPLLEALNESFEKDESVPRLLDSLTYALRPYSMELDDSGVVKQYFHIDRLNPELRNWVKDKTEALVKARSPSGQKMKTLACQFFHNDYELFAMILDELFDSRTPPQTRDRLFDEMLNFDVHAEAKAAVLILLIQNQFESTIGEGENEIKKNRLREKLIVDVLGKEVHQSKLEKLNSDQSLNFKVIQELQFGKSGVVHLNSPFAGTGGMGGRTEKPQSVSGAPAVVRRCLTLLWEYEAECTEKFSEQIIGPAVDEILLHYKTEIESVYFKPELEPLKILDDMMELVKVANSREAKVNETGAGKNDDMFNSIGSTTGPGSIFVQQAKQNQFGGGMGSGGNGQGGGGVF